MNSDTPSAGSIAAGLAEYLASEILGDGSIVDPDQNLLVDEVVDSLGLLRMVGYLERSYGVKIPPEEYVIDNFRSLNTIGNYIVRTIG
jgi:acyl carrier protein